MDDPSTKPLPPSHPEFAGRPTWDQLHPIFPPRVTREEAEAHYRTRMAIGALPRNILGMALLVATGRMPPPRRTGGRPVNRQAIEETNRRLQAMREEQASKVVDTTDMAVAELRVIAATAEAQATFEAQMRATELRRGLDS